MERKSTNENLEHFLRQNAEEFRIHPSQKVWDNISENLAKRKRKFYFGLAVLLISSSILGYTLLDFSFSKIAGNTTPVSSLALKNNTNLSTKTAEPVKKRATVMTVNQPAQKLANQTLVTDINPNEIGTASNSFANYLSTQRQNFIADLITSPSQITSPPQNFFSALSPNKYSIDLNNPGVVAIEKKSTEILPFEEDNDNVAPAIKQNNKARKFSFMFFFTPTVSYRKLSENKSYLRSISPIGVPYNVAALYDINNAVTHKPNIGLEFGMTSKYSITKNIKLRAGLQFNLNRYDIKAFKYTPERATIALNNGSSGVQSISTPSTYRNFNGGQIDWLQNSYFQVSTPVGAEVKLHGNDKIYIGAATTIQPTYVLGDRAYLITADYKNYAQVPWLMRHWNVNTNLETFVAYSTGKLKWQVGPQVRYQLLSSFVNKYPVKENLFDFGLKVGISVNQKQ